MPNDKNKYSAEFKIKVAREALEQDKENLEKLSEKHGVPVSDILTWATKLENHSAEAFEEYEEPTEPESGISDGETVDVEVSDRDIADSVRTGVMLDRLNYRRLVFWSVFGIVLVLVFIFSLREMHQFNTQVTQERISAESEYYEVNQLNRQATEKLNSFGIVDPENGIYRIPIDSAISDMVENQN